MNKLNTISASPSSKLQQQGATTRQLPICCCF
uniref:Uncharacterized protein n=1 Tax=Rhizophora mucronata TaxID=61149 RepID=A0A2P2NWN6_RHIMU